MLDMLDVISYTGPTIERGILMVAKPTRRSKPKPPLKAPWKDARRANPFRETYMPEKIYWPTEIIIHCSDSDWGSLKVIDDWHRARGWSGCGYHYIVCNDRPDHGKIDPGLDGVLECGRVVIPGEGIAEGAHCRGHNRSGVGICLVGRQNFTEAQMSEALRLCRALMDWYDIPPKKVRGHLETESGRACGKSCPNIDMEDFRRRLIGDNRKEREMNDAASLKSGVKSSEFWVTLIPMVVLPLLSLFGMDDVAKDLAPYLVGSAGVYTGGRSAVKCKKEV